MNNNNTSNNFKVFLGRLPLGTNDEILREVLANAGINPSKILLRKNYALIDLADGLSTEEAIPRLNGMYNLSKSPLSVWFKSSNLPLHKFYNYQFA